MNKNYRYKKGRIFEYEIVKRLQNEGWDFVSRLPASKRFDITAWRKDTKEFMLCECKTGNIKKSEIERKKEEAMKIGATLRIYIKNKLNEEDISEYVEFKNNEIKKTD